MPYQRIFLLFSIFFFGSGTGIGSWRCASRGSYYCRRKLLFTWEIIIYRDWNRKLEMCVKSNDASGVIIKMKKKN